MSEVDTTLVFNLEPNAEKGMNERKGRKRIITPGLRTNSRIIYIYMGYESISKSNPISSGKAAQTHMDLLCY